MKLIDADKLSADMYHEAFVKDSDMQKWDNGCWIRYKMFEDVLKAQPVVQPNTTTHDSIPAETGKNDGDKTSGDCISRQATCEYCHEDSDGYVLSVEKNGHAYIQNGKLALRANGWWGECRIEYCPMCGRKLRGEQE